MIIEGVNISLPVMVIEADLAFQTGVLISADTTEDTIAIHGMSGAMMDFYRGSGLDVTTITVIVTTAMVVSVPGLGITMFMIGIVVTGIRT